MVKKLRLRLKNFTFIHDFDASLQTFQITGHIHPGIVLNSAVKSIRLPCFALSHNQLLLPAFSEFTGLDTKNLPGKSKFLFLQIQKFMRFKILKSSQIINGNSIMTAQIE